MGNFSQPPQGYISMRNEDVVSGAERYRAARKKALVERREAFIRNRMEQETGYRKWPFCLWWPRRTYTRAEAEERYEFKDNDLIWYSARESDENLGRLWADAVDKAGHLAALKTSGEEMLVSIELAMCLTGEQV